MNNNKRKIIILDEAYRNFPDMSVFGPIPIDGPTSSLFGPIDNNLREIWKKAFRNAAIKTNTIPEDIAITLSKAPYVIDLILKPFNFNRAIPSAHDFAIIIAFEIDQHHYRYCIEKNVECWQVRGFAVAVRKEWLLLIGENDVLKDKLKNIIDKHPSKFNVESSSCLPEVDDILKNKKELKRIFFRLKNV